MHVIIICSSALRCVSRGLSTNHTNGGTRRPALFVCCVRNGKRKAPRAATGAQARPAREIHRRCACFAQGAAFCGGGKSRRRFSGGGARLAHTKTSPTCDSHGRSCVLRRRVAALVGLGRVGLPASLRALIENRGPICVVLSRPTRVLPPSIADAPTNLIRLAHSHAASLHRR